MAAKKPAEPKPQGAPMWIVTFTDMTSLLLTFFIMMLTFSSMEDEKMKQATGSLSGAFGVMTPNRKRARTESDAQLATRYREQEKEGPTDASVRPDQVQQNLKKIQDREIFNMQITRTDLAEGTRLNVETIGNEEHFVLGGNSVGNNTKRLLREIAMMFSGLQVRLVIETHCDTEVPESLLLTPMEFTTKNGLLAATELIKQGMTPERVGVCPRGDLEPVASNDSPSNRFKNRRLSILVIPDGIDDAFGVSGE